MSAQIVCGTWLGIPDATCTCGYHCGYCHIKTGGYCCSCCAPADEQGFVIDLEHAEESIGRFFNG